MSGRQFYCSAGRRSGCSRILWSLLASFLIGSAWSPALAGDPAESAIPGARRLVERPDQRQDHGSDHSNRLHQAGGGNDRVR